MRLDLACHDIVEHAQLRLWPDFWTRECVALIFMGSTRISIPMINYLHPSPPDISVTGSVKLPRLNLGMSVARKKFVPLAWVSN